MLKKILVIQTAFIGNAVLAAALLEKLNQFYPTAAISILVRKGNEDLFEEHPYLDQVLIWDKKKNKYRDLWRILQVIRKERFDLVVNVHRFASTGFLTVFSGAKHTVGFHKNPFSFFYSTKVTHLVADGVHEVQRNQALIEHVTDQEPARPRLYPSEKHVAQVSLLKRNPYVCIAPSSVWFTKQFPEDKWVELIHSLPPNLIVYIIGGIDDHAIGERITKSVNEPERVINLCGQLRFLESAALQKEAIRNFVNDSAPMHFASAVNAPVTAIYCSTIPAFGYGPLSNDHAIVESKENLSCRPCGIHGLQQCPRGDFACAYSISKEQIVETIQITG